MKSLIIGSLCVAGLMVGCSSEPKGDAARSGRAAEAITRGALDTTHQSVMFLYDSGKSAACTGTVVAVKGTSGFFLTAAHCVSGATASKLVILQGNDSAKASIQYPVTDFLVHKDYTGGDGPVYDFAMVKFTGAGGTTPTTPFLTKALDDLAAGANVTIVGYGKTSASDSGNSARRFVTNKLANNAGGYAVSALQLSYRQDGALGGACSGDSGGPVLYTLGGVEYVAGVTSYGDENCAVFGVSGRVSAVADWAEGYIDGTPINPPQTCDECRQASTSGVGSCSGTVADCVNDADCNALLTCLGSCADGDSACTGNCASSHQGGAAVYRKIFDCVCDTGCKDACASDASCQTPACGFSFSNQTCSTCVDGACCAEEQACADDSACAACASSANPDASCNSNRKLIEFSLCYRKSCATECGITQSKCGFSASGAGCQTCFETKCCAESQACANDVDCYLCEVSSPRPATCASNALASAFDACIASECAAECGGGSTGTGGAGSGGASGAGGGAATPGSGGSWSPPDGGAAAGSTDAGSSGTCSLVAPGRAGGAAWVLLGLAALGGLRRRRVARAA